MVRDRRRRRKSNGYSGPIWVVALTLLLLGIVGAYLALKGQQGENATDETTGCLKNRPAPEAVMFMVDTTDRLSEANAELVVTAVHDMADKLPRYSKVIVVPFGNDLASPLQPVFSQCLPGRGDEAGLAESPRFVEESYGKFDSAVRKLGDRLQNLSDAETSPITQQIVRAASTPVLHWQAETRTLVLFTDGLESTVYWTKELKLREPPNRILDRVKVEYYELGNERNGRFQTAQLREQWRSWFEKAGAAVRMTAPGYASQDN